MNPCTLFAIGERYRIMFSEDEILKAYVQLRRLYKLTLRETEMFLYFVHGKKNREIAPEACITYKTVRTHRTNIYAKTKTNSKYGLTEIARGLGLV